MILGKALALAAGVGCLSIVPIVSKGFYSSPVDRKVFLITQSSGGGIKLFVEEIKKSKEESEFVLKLLSGKKEITVKKGNSDLKDRFFLCSPRKNKDDYFLLRLDNFSHKYNLKGDGVSECEDKYRSTLGEVLGVSTDDREVLQKIDLQHCEITKTETSLKMSCKELWGSANKKMEILSKSYENLTI